MVDPALFASEFAIVADMATDMDVSNVDLQRANGTVLALLWFVFAVMAVGVFAVGALAWTVPVKKRAYHYLAATVLTISALSYFSIATAYSNYPEDVRLVSQIRYTDQSLSLPLIVVILGMISGLDIASVFAGIVAVLVMVLSAFANGAAVGTATIVGWSMFAVLSYLFLAYHFLVHARRCARGKSPAITRFCTVFAVYNLAVWLAYVVFWITSRDEHGHGAATNVGVAVCAVLDVLAKCVPGAWVVYAFVKVPGLGSEGGDEGRIRIGENGE